MRQVAKFLPKEIANAANSKAAEAPLGLRIAATITSVSNTKRMFFISHMIRETYHITGNIRLPAIKC
ncbi:hypothetical protein BZZ01_19665 [Nostocales cyanobacterium HT-58-2]|nr:hypothetical protein BZZ01_19665 [Nostocales cyanobacterium HT-58-2]